MTLKKQLFYHFKPRDSLHLSTLTLRGYRNSNILFLLLLLLLLPCSSFFKCRTENYSALLDFPAQTLVKVFEFILPLEEHEMDSMDLAYNLHFVIIYWGRNIRSLKIQNKNMKKKEKEMYNTCWFNQISLLVILNYLFYWLVY